jgi:hypothetical protein
MLNHEDGSVREVFFIMASNNRLGNIDILIVMGALIEAVDSARTRSTSVEWLALMVREASKSEKQSASRVVNGREYTVSFPPGLGIWFVVSQPG